MLLNKPIKCVFLDFKILSLDEFCVLMMLDDVYWMSLNENLSWGDEYQDEFWWIFNFDEWVWKKERIEKGEESCTMERRKKRMMGFFFLLKEI